MKILGRVRDTNRLRHISSLDVLEVANSRWTPSLNLAWMEPTIRQGEPFLVISPCSDEDTILAWELRILKAAGYRRIGSWLVPPL